MTTSLSGRWRLRARLAPVAALLAIGLTATGCNLPFTGPSTKHFSADFDRAVGVYKHSDVRVLGVKIGQVSKITPKGRFVHLDMEYDSSYKIPADAKAVITAPSIVSDRYVQLTPVYQSGMTLADRTNLSLDRTAVPVELDQIYSSLDSLNSALGPNGANSKGALSDLLKVSAQNLKGNGQALNGTLTGLSQAVQTLADNRGDLFGTISNLQQFTTVIAQSDSTVRTFNSRLAAVAAQLSGERIDLAVAVRELAAALTEVASFVKQNKTDLTANITDLASVTRVLVDQKRALREFLDTAPAALSNLQLAYNSTSGTLDTRDNSQSQGGPAQDVCTLLTAAHAPPALCDALKKLIPSSGAPKSPLGVKPSSARDLTLGGILGASS